MRYFIIFSYDGTNYHGWQKQPNGVSVQEVLEKALSTLLRRPTEVVGAGRTDAGVHASMMVAHFDHSAPAAEGEAAAGTDASALDCAQLTYKLNKLLPHDVAVKSVSPVADDMHARFSARARTYYYYIRTRKDPYLRHYSWFVPFTLDFALMNEAAKHLLDYTDFTSFSKVNTDTKTNLCTITKALWTHQGGALSPGMEGSDVWRFEITANRFLRNMVRAIVGTLVEVGRGRMSVAEFCRVIEQKNRCSAGESVPGNALFLVKVDY
ncbi:MAG: tRNA pseudouridine(38-40) synthase TruA [Bacteroidales bacterium]|nr:tRNA pseudouridine(38-40) synthase TruA [Candidatus Physcousia equi]